MTEDLIDQSCDRHRTDRHVFVHEAGHAVAALDIGIPFRAVIVYADGEGPSLTDGLTEAGATVDTGPDPSAWVEPDRLGSFRFVCAGAAAEVGILEHEAGETYKEDIRVWRRGSKTTAAMTPEEFTEAVGESPDQVFAETTEWAEEHRQAHPQTR